MSSRRSSLGWLGYGALLAVALTRRGGGHDRSKRRRASTSSTSSAVFDRASSADELRETQHQRSAETGRGRRAASPEQIPLRGWKDIFWRTYQGINDNRILAVAAGVVFYGLLAIFPAIVAFVSIYGLFADPSSVNNQLSMVNGVLPSGAIDVVRDQVSRVASNSGTKLGFGFIIGLAIALWSSNSGMKAIIDALNVVYHEKEKRSFLKLNLASLGLTLAALASLLLAIGAVVVLPVALNFIGFGAAADLFIRIVRWPILLALVVVGLAALYRYAPSRREPRWRWISLGSLFAAIVWLVASLLFSWYVANFGSYNATYGSLGAVIGMMTWMWISTIIILVGAQINAEIEHQSAKDSTEEADKPLGARGAVIADTVGAAQT